MARYRAAIIGCGRKGPPPGVTEGQGIAYRHAAGYQEAGNVALVAAADIDATNLRDFTETFTGTAGYGDYRAMLARERPDLVSICTWPGLHAEMVIAAAQAGVRGILCEKPMTLSLRDADHMLAACARSGALLSICHQRRLVQPWTTARSWIEAGHIGRLLQMEAWIEQWDLLSYGTHWVDMFFYMMHDSAARWVLAQVDCTTRKQRYAHPVEDRSLTMIGFDDEVTGTLHIAPEARGAGVRLIGSDGYIEVQDSAREARLVSDPSRWPAESEERPASGMAFASGFTAAVRDLGAAIDTGRESELCGQRGRKVLEVIMAAYASGIERRLIPLPYDGPAFPLERLFAPRDAPDRT